MPHMMWWDPMYLVYIAPALLLAALGAVLGVRSTYQEAVAAAGLGKRRRCGPAYSRLGRLARCSHRGDSGQLSDHYDPSQRVSGSAPTSIGASR